MNNLLPAELAEVERLLESTRAPLPQGLRARVLSLRPSTRMSFAWFAAAAAAAAAVLLNLSSSAALQSERREAPPDRCALARALHEAPETCLEKP